VVGGERLSADARAADVGASVSDYIYAPKKDANHEAIIKAYEALHCSVADTHKVPRFVDLVVGIAGVTCPVEIKTDGGELEPHQKLFSKLWRGSRVEVVRTVDDVAAHVQRVRARFST
jgi:hypothetical protein